MNNIFEITEKPTLENTSKIENKGLKIKKPQFTLGKTSILKIMVDGKPFYHFLKGEFDNELATQNLSMVVSGKRFYRGLKNNSMMVRLRLSTM